MEEIVIIGAGFAGLTAVRTLRKEGYKSNIKLIAPQKKFIYIPSAIWIPSRRRKREELEILLDNFCQRHNVEFVQASVTGLDAETKVVRTDRADQSEISYTKLLIASGSRFIKKLPGIEHALIPCANLEASEKIRDRIEQMDGGTIAFGFSGNPKEPSAMRGGPMFEYMYGIDTMLRQQKRRDQFNLVFFTPAAQPGKRLGGRAMKGIMGEMKKRGIKSYHGNKLKQFTHNAVETEKHLFDSDLTIFIPGMTGLPWFAESGLPLSEGGLIQADPNCRVAGLEDVYVAGDSGSFPGPEWMPKQAHMADLQAEAAVKNMLAELDGKPVTHTFKPELACIIDSNTTGVLVYRSAKRSIIMKGFFLHWTKLFFEWLYLRKIK